MKTMSQLASATRRGAFAVTLLALSGSALAYTNVLVNTNITEADVKAAQEGWGKALIQISDDYASGGIAKAKATATAVLDAAYGYNMGVVLFKPTLAYGERTFRTNQAGALSYFVGNDAAYPEDTGFALKGWTKYEFKNAGVFVSGDLALTQGHVILTDKAGKVTIVDKSWGFKKDNKGQMRIVLHHSSLPYQPAK